MENPVGRVADDCVHSGEVEVAQVPDDDVNHGVLETDVVQQSLELAVEFDGYHASASLSEASCNRPRTGAGVEHGERPVRHWEMGEHFENDLVNE